MLKKFFYILKVFYALYSVARKKIYIFIKRIARTSFRGTTRYFYLRKYLNCRFLFFKKVRRHFRESRKGIKYSKKLVKTNNTLKKNFTKAIYISEFI